MSKKFFRILQLNKQVDERYSQALNALEIARLNIVLRGDAINQELYEKIQKDLRNIRISIDDTSRQIPFVENGKHYDDSLGQWQRKLDSRADRWLKLHIVPDWVLSKKANLDFLLVKFDQILSRETGVMAEITVLEAQGRIEGEIDRQDQKPITDEATRAWLKLMRGEQLQEDVPPERSIAKTVEATEADQKLLRMLNWLHELFGNNSTQWDLLPKGTKAVLQDLENETNAMRFQLSKEGASQEISQFLSDYFEELKSMVGIALPLALSLELPVSTEFEVLNQPYIRHGSKPGVAPARIEGEVNAPSDRTV